jgi:hypothetical protein
MELSEIFFKSMVTCFMFFSFTLLIVLITPESKVEELKESILMNISAKIGTWGLLISLIGWIWF